MTIAEPTDRPEAELRLAAAFRFVDRFTEQSVPVPLRVRVAALEWDAVRGRDGTYRFVLDSRPRPTGTHPVEITAPGGEYVRHTAAPTIVVPPTFVMPPVAKDILRTEYLWPTPTYRLPAGETALVARLRKGATILTGVEVQLAVADPPAVPWPARPAAPLAVTGAGGWFVFVYRYPREKLTGPAESVTPVTLMGRAWPANTLTAFRDPVKLKPGVVDARATFIDLS